MGFRKVVLTLFSPENTRNNRTFDYYGETATHFILSEEVGKVEEAERSAFGIPKEAVLSLTFLDPTSPATTPCALCGRVPKDVSEANLVAHLAPQLAGITEETFVKPGQAKISPPDGLLQTYSLITCTALHATFGDRSFLYHVTADTPVERIRLAIQKLIGKKGQPSEVTLYKGLGMSRDEALKENLFQDSPSELSTQVILKGLKEAGVTTPITLVPVCWAEVVPI